MRLTGFWSVRCYEVSFDSMGEPGVGEIGEEGATPSHRPAPPTLPRLSSPSGSSSPFVEPRGASLSKPRRSSLPSRRSASHQARAATDVAEQRRATTTRSHRCPCSSSPLDPSPPSRFCELAASSRQSPSLSVKRSHRAPPMTSLHQASKRERKTVREDERERGSRSSHHRRTQSPSSSREPVVVAGMSHRHCCCEATVSVSCSALSLFLVSLLCAEVAAAVMVDVGLLVPKQSCYCCCSIPLFFSSFSISG
ncbi:uncharacterized protein LOC127746633 [Arachis duranensis]|uniref:Uncharacterized protein LOC127746633 n=1 Tax=Arachis duranensis TaxID=130453 RepID=A0A9C6TW43_ARADU|nr:uncharacterized protein LOC127746633 [Arachis duranensis]